MGAEPRRVAAAVDRQRHIRRQPDQGHPTYGRHRPCENPAEAKEAGRSDKIGGATINVLLVEPGVLPYEKEINDLSAMRKTVGGRIQAIYPSKDNVAVVCNEEGLLLNLEFNRSLPE